jgi:predicted methyltransferase
MTLFSRPAALVALALSAAIIPATSFAMQATPYATAIASPLRTDADRKEDAKRKPAQFLAFAQVKPGMKVLDVSTASGGTAALLALAVGPAGEVWAQNTKPSDKLAQRLSTAPMANVHPFVAPFDHPVPASAPPLDLITINLNYHDIVNTATDRALMNKALFTALKPGGVLVITDNAAKSGSGLADTKTLHRIDEAAVVAELTQAGFTLDARSDYLHVASDPHMLPFFKMNGEPDDKFALRFIKK